MANDHSITNNPIFQNTEYLFTELFMLLPKLNRLDSSNDLGNKADTEVLKAIYQHAENAIYILLGGIQSLGTLLATAIDNKSMGITTTEISNISWLLRAMGNILSGCYVLQGNVSTELAKRGIHLN